MTTQNTLLSRLLTTTTTKLQWMCALLVGIEAGRRNATKFTQTLLENLPRFAHTSFCS